MPCHGRRQRSIHSAADKGGDLNVAQCLVGHTKATPTVRRKLILCQSANGCSES